MAIFKILVSAVIIWAASEAGKRSGKLGGLILSLPISSLIAILWLWFETKSTERVAALTSETAVFILPSFVFFICLPLLLNRQVQFYFAFAASVLLTMGSYAIFFKLHSK